MGESPSHGHTLAPSLLTPHPWQSPRAFPRRCPAHTWPYTCLPLLPVIFLVLPEIFVIFWGMTGESQLNEEAKENG